MTDAVLRQWKMGEYIVSQNGDGEISCSCPAGKFHRTCYHAGLLTSYLKLKHELKGDPTGRSCATCNVTFSAGEWCVRIRRGKVTSFLCLEHAPPESKKTWMVKRIGATGFPNEPPEADRP